MGRIRRVLFIVGAFSLVGVFGGIIAVQLFLHQEKLTAPNLIGQEVTVVSDLLNKKGLRLQIAEHISSAVVPANHVIKQEPAPGEWLAKGAEVKIVLSSGLSETLLPEVRGEYLHRAKRLIEGNSLQIGEIVRVRSETTPEDKVIAQSPLPGQNVPKGSPVNVLVSAGKRKVAYVMPDLRGESLIHTQERLKELQFQLGEVRYTEQIPGKPGTVVEQSPSPGARVEEGATVSLTLIQPAEFLPNEGEGKFALLRYQVPSGLAPQRIRIVVRNREVFNQMQDPGSEVRLLIPVQGETRALIYSDGTLVEEKHIQ